MLPLSLTLQRGLSAIAELLVSSLCSVWNYVFIKFGFISLSSCLEYEIVGVDAAGYTAVS